MCVWKDLAQLLMIVIFVFGIKDCLLHFTFNFYITYFMF